jgi:hypothetical protein
MVEYRGYTCPPARDVERADLRPRHDGLFKFAEDECEL